MFAVALRLTWPLALVTAVAALSVAPAPLAGGVKVTVIPGTGWLAASRTTATSCAAKAVFTVALWPLPLTTLIEVGMPTLLSENEAGVTPLTVAVTE